MHRGREGHPAGNIAVDRCHQGIKVKRIRRRASYVKDKAPDGPADACRLLLLCRQSCCQKPRCKKQRFSQSLCQACPALNGPDKRSAAPAKAAKAALQGCRSLVRSIESWTSLA